MAAQNSGQTFKVERKNTKLSTRTNNLMVKIQELQDYLTAARNSAKILQNFLVSQLILKRIFNKETENTMEPVEGGPKAIVKSTIKNLSHILNEVEIKIQVKSKIDKGEEVNFPSRFYESILHHILIWSINISKSQSKVFVNLNVDTLFDGIIFKDKILKPF